EIAAREGRGAGEEGGAAYLQDLLRAETRAGASFDVEAEAGRAARLYSDLRIAEAQRDMELQERLLEELTRLVRRGLLLTYNAAEIEAVAVKFRWDMMGFYGYGDRLLTELTASTT